MCQTVEWRSEASSAMSASHCLPPNKSNEMNLLIGAKLFLHSSKHTGDVILNLIHLIHLIHVIHVPCVMYYIAMTVDKVYTFK